MKHHNRQRRTRVVLAFLFAAIAIAVLLTGCDTKSDVRKTGRSGIAGEVVKRQRGKYPALVIRSAGGKTTKVLVRTSVLRRCKVGESYPRCAR